MVLTEATARAVRGIQPDGADPAAPVFGLTGETLANRIRAAARAVDCGGPAPRAMEARRHGPPATLGARPQERR